MTPAKLSITNLPAKRALIRVSIQCVLTNTLSVCPMRLQASPMHAKVIQ